MQMGLVVDPVEEQMRQRRGELVERHEGLHRRGRMDVDVPVVEDGVHEDDVDGDVNDDGVVGHDQMGHLLPFLGPVDPVVVELELGWTMRLTRRREIMMVGRNSFVVSLWAIGFI